MFFTRTKKNGLISTIGGLGKMCLSCYVITYNMNITYSPNINIHALKHVKQH